MFDSISPALAPYLAGSNPNPPPRLGIRFDATGRFLPEPGNTIVCHLVEDSPSATALRAVRERMMHMPGADCLAFTPEPSLHMTLFQGVIEFRRDPVYWPAGIPRDTGIAEMTRLMQARLKSFAPRAPFRVKPVAVKPTGVAVAGATEADTEALKAWRDALADVLGYRHPDHDRYVFHITYAYLLRGIPDALAPRWQEFLDAGLGFLAREAPVIALRPPAFCSFRDMNHFEELLVLA